MVCKHMFAVFFKHPQWTFSHLPESFTKTPLLMLDSVVTPLTYQLKAHHLPLLAPESSSVSGPSSSLGLLQPHDSSAPP